MSLVTISLPVKMMRPWKASSSTFEKSHSFDEDKRTLAEYSEILLNKPHCPGQSKQLKLLHRASDDRSLPRLANVLGVSLGNQIFEEVEQVMKSRPGE